MFSSVSTASGAPAHCTAPSLTQTTVSAARRASASSWSVITTARFCRWLNSSRMSSSSS